MEQTLPYIKLHHEDDVVIARNQLAADTVLEALGSLRVLVDIPAAHKLAIRPLKNGQPIRRYGQIIGFASADIAAGEHVHTHNTSMGSFERDYAFGQDARPVEFVTSTRTFDGIQRADGRVATRNYIGVVSTVNCSATVSKLVAQHFSQPGMLDAYPNVDAVVPITHSFGC